MAKINRSELVAQHLFDHFYGISNSMNKPNLPVFGRTTFILSFYIFSAVGRGRFFLLFLENQYLKKNF